MTQEDFIAELRSVLDEHTDIARDALHRLVARIPAKAQGLNLMMFTSQEGDGQFDVFGAIDGPDHYFINRQITDVRDILSVRHTESGFRPAVPMVDPFDVRFDVNETVIQCVSEWLHRLWNTTSGLALAVPVSIVGHDGVCITKTERCTGQ